MKPEARARKEVSLSLSTIYSTADFMAEVMIDNSVLQKLLQENGVFSELEFRQARGPDYEKRHEALTETVAQSILARTRKYRKKLAEQDRQRALGGSHPQPAISQTS